MSARSHQYADLSAAAILDDQRRMAQTRVVQPLLDGALACFMWTKATIIMARHQRHVQQRCSLRPKARAIEQRSFVPTFTSRPPAQRLQNHLFNASESRAEVAGN
jgi:hypothetical protein